MSLWCVTRHFWGLISAAIIMSGCTFDASIIDEKILDSMIPETTGAPLIISPATSINLVTGETYLFGASGGIAPYSYSDSGSGFVSPSGSYVAPLNSPPQSDFVRVTDSLAQATQVSVNVQSFVQALNFTAATSENRAIQIADMISFDGAVYLVARSTSVINYAPFTTPTYSLILKSIDNGTTWLQVGSYKYTLGIDFNPMKLISFGTDLYIVGTALEPTGTNRKMIIAKSLDKGVSWSTEIEFSDSGKTISLSDAIVSGDGSNIVAVGYSALGADLYSNIYTCSLTLSTCSVKTEAIATLVYNWFTSIKADGLGNLYAGGTIRTDSVTGGVKILKSTDNGNSWVTLMDTSGTNRQLQDFAVSTDGSYFAWVGVSGVSTPLVYLSTDSGATWNISASGCTGWNNNKVVVNSSKDILVSCNAPMTNQNIILKKVFGGAWSTTTSDTGSSYIYRNLHHLGGDSVFASTSSSLARTTNFGGWSLLTYPSLANEPMAGLLNATIQGETNSILYSVGSVSDGTYSQSMVYKSTDGGLTWNNEYQLALATNSTFTSIARSPTTNTLIAGGAEGPRWQLHRSPLLGPWASAEVYSTGAATATLNTILSTSGGQFVALGKYSSEANANWYLRTSNDDGVTWSELDNFQLALDKYSEAMGGTTHGNDIYAVGYGVDSSSKYHWLVRRYSGGTWTTIDDETFSATATYASANAALAASDGYLYVAGEYTDGGITYWAVKRKLLSGGVWETVDVYNYASTASSASSIAEDTQGRIFVAGYAKNSLGTKYATIRMTRNGTSWYLVSQLNNMGFAKHTNITPCLNSSICVTGQDLSPTHIINGTLYILQGP